MKKGIPKKEDESYTYNKLVNLYLISEKDNPYGHVKEFMNLSKNKRYEAHRVISSKALDLYSKNICLGAIVDINGNIYYFEIFEGANYRVINVDKYIDIT